MGSKLTAEPMLARERRAGMSERRRGGRLRSLVWLLVGSGLLWLAPGDAEACINGTYSRVDTGIAWASVVEGNLNRGRNEAVVEKVLARHGRVRSIEVGHDAVSNRVLRLMALAVVRLDGKPPRAKDFPSATAADVASNLDWAISKLRALYARNDDDATLRCDLGEALASQEMYHAEAFRLLDNLEQRDLVVSSRAYAKLSELRRARGAGTPAFIAGPAGELGRVRSDLEAARSSRMVGKDISRPINKADLARSRAATPGRRAVVLRPPLG